MSGKMMIYTLWAHRKESYPGQYAPELLASIDEYSHDDNPIYLDNEQDEAEKSKEFDHIQRITLTISEDEFNKQFYGESIEATIS